MKYKKFAEEKKLSVEIEFNTEHRLTNGIEKNNIPHILEILTTEPIQDIDLGTIARALNTMTNDARFINNIQLTRTLRDALDARLDITRDVTAWGLFSCKHADTINNMLWRLENIIKAADRAEPEIPRAQHVPQVTVQIPPQNEHDADLPHPISRGSGRSDCKKTFAERVQEHKANDEAESSNRDQLTTQPPSPEPEMLLGLDSPIAGYHNW